MKTLKSLWLESGKNHGQKFRYVDWNHCIKFFQIQGVTDDGVHYFGTLDCGRRAVFHVESDFWSSYYEGDENQARAV